MSYRETGNPWGGNFASPIDRLLGTAFLQVRQVYENLDLLNQISQNLSALQSIATGIATSPAISLGASVIGFKVAQADQSKVDVVPTTSFSQVIANNCTTLLLKPAGTLATGTVVMPAAPVDGQTARVISSQTITALTVSPSAGQSISGAPTTIGAATPFSMIYDLASTTWFRR